MTTASMTPAVSHPSAERRLSTFLYRRPVLSLLLLLIPPLLWLGILYIGSLLALLIQSFYRLDGFTGRVVREFGLSTYGDLLTQAHFDIMARTALMAAAVTIAAAFVAFPIAYYMARYAGRRTRAFLYLAVLLPLWSSYLVRVYAWKFILAKEGVFHWFISQIGLQGLLNAVLDFPLIGGESLSVSPLGLFLVFLYVWLPYMILPVAAALERVPRSLLEASGDLGARPEATFQHVTLPLAFPGVVAGSIFTFSLTLGDFIIPTIIGDSSPFIGLAVYQYQGTAGNVPLAAAFTIVPMVIMAAYLIIAKRLGAFDAL
ncbi:MAG TPA: ABC transporter permease [Anaerolineae bacterium]|nr:ABC transporter permease [Anaerolineae bacterium]